jgi:hypothetical protein
MGGFIALTIAARHASMIRHVVVLASRASGPALTIPPGIEKLACSITNATIANLVVEGSFPKGSQDPGE